MTDCGNNQIFLGSTWSSYPPKFIQNNLFSEETLIFYLTKHTYHILEYSWFCLVFVFSTQKHQQSGHFDELFSFQFFACLSFIFSVYGNLDMHILFSSTLLYFCQFASTKIIIWLFNTCYFFLNKMKPMFVINNINIATADDIITLKWWRKHISCIFIRGNYHFDRKVMLIG